MENCSDHETDFFSSRYSSEFHLFIGNGVRFSGYNLCCRFVFKYSFHKCINSLNVYLSLMEKGTGETYFNDIQGELFMNSHMNMFRSFSSVESTSIFLSYRIVTNRSNFLITLNQIDVETNVWKLKWITSSSVLAGLTSTTNLNNFGMIFLNSSHYFLEWTITSVSCL